MERSGIAPVVSPSARRVLILQGFANSYSMAKIAALFGVHYMTVSRVVEAVGDGLHGDGVGMLDLTPEVL